MRRMLAILIALLFSIALSASAEIQWTRAEYDLLCERLLEAEWIGVDAQKRIERVDGQIPMTRYAIGNDEKYAEMLIMDGDVPLQYAFFGNIDSVEEIEVCLKAAGMEQADENAQALMKAYEASAEYGRTITEAAYVPKGSLNREDCRYELSGGWLYIMHTEALGKVQYDGQICRSNGK